MSITGISVPYLLTFTRVQDTEWNGMEWNLWGGIASCLTVTGAKAARNRNRCRFIRLHIFLLSKYIAIFLARYR